MAGGDNKQRLDPKQRLDQWLWFARMFKTRTLAGKVVRSGKVRVNSIKQNKASTMVAPGDVLTFPRADAIMVLEVVALGIRRGPAPEAQLLYTDITPAPPPADDKKAAHNVAIRKAGSGRPTKRERRALNKLLPDPELD